MKVSLPYLLLLAVFASCGSDEQPAQEAATTVQPGTVLAKRVFDVRALLFASAAQIKQQLGKPATEDKLTPIQRKMDMPIEMDFKKDSITLIIIFSSKTGKPKEFFLMFPHPTPSDLPLLRAGGLKAQGGAQYTVVPKWVNLDSRFYTGILIIPTQ